MIKLSKIVAVATVTIFAVVGSQAALAHQNGGSKAEAKNIVETASAAGSFGTLLAAAKAAGLVEALSGEGPLTVFAPTDDAFKKLPAGTVETLLLPENKDKLAAVLTYHVIPGKVMSGDIAGKKLEAETLQGGKANINATGGKVMIDNAQVINADISASNGVIHVIDNVILPAGL